jgi:hypothetical protein
MMCDRCIGEIWKMEEIESETSSGAELLQTDDESK